MNDLAFIGERQQLYQVLMSIGGNVELPVIMPTALLHLLRLQSFPYLGSDTRRQITTEYLRIIEAVLEGDPARAAQQGKRRALTGPGSLRSRTTRCDQRHIRRRLP